MKTVDIAASTTPNSTSFGPLLFPGDMDSGLSCLSALGYRGIECSLRTPWDIVPGRLFDSLERNGLLLLSIATGQSYLEDGYSLFAMDKENREGAVKRILEYINLASIQDSTVILGGIKGRLDGVDDETQFHQGMDSIRRCVEYAEKKEVVLLIESINRYESNIFNTIEDSACAAASIDSDYLKLLPDTFHMNIEERSLTEPLVKFRDQIGAVHCADSNRLAPGMGHIDFQPVIHAALEMPNLKYLGIEVLPVPDSRACAEKAINTLMECLEEVED